MFYEHNKNDIDNNVAKLFFKSGEAVVSAGEIAY